MDVKRLLPYNPTTVVQYKLIIGTVKGKKP